MAKTITQLPDATVVNAADELIVQQGGVTKRATKAEVLNGIVNANVDAAAAIAGTKIAPAFGAQDITVSTANRSITNTGNFALSFGTNNTERVRIDSSGNVGIATSSPSAPLSIAHSGNVSFGTAIQVATTGGTDDPMISLQNHNAGSPVRYGISCADDGSLAFRSGGWTGAFGDERMRITSAGIVGIGTTTPSSTALLDIASTSRGFLPPRMTGAQRDAIATPPAGLILYNSTTNKLQVRTDAAWVDLH